MPHSIAARTRHLKKLRLALLGAASAVSFAALTSGARAQIPVTCNSDSSNDFACGVSTSATGGSSTAVGDSVAADTARTTMIGAFAHREASDGATGVGALATASTNGTAGASSESQRISARSTLSEIAINSAASAGSAARSR